jgi:hypothetical protein
MCACEHACMHACVLLLRISHMHTFKIGCVGVRSARFVLDRLVLVRLQDTSRFVLVRFVLVGQDCTGQVTKTRLRLYIILNFHLCS